MESAVSQVDRVDWPVRGRRFDEISESVGTCVGGEIDIADAIREQSVASQQIAHRVERAASIVRVCQTNAAAQ